MHAELVHEITGERGGKEYEGKHSMTGIMCAKRRCGGTDQSIRHEGHTPMGMNHVGEVLVLETSEQRSGFMRKRQFADLEASCNARSC